MLSRAKVAFKEAVGGRTARVRTNGSAQTCDLRYFGTPTSVGRRQGQASQLIIPGVLSLRANRLLEAAVENEAQKLLPHGKASDTGSPRHWAIVSERSRADWLMKTRPTRRSWINCGEASRFNMSRSRIYGFANCVVARLRRVEFVQPRFRALDRPLSSATRNEKQLPRRDKAFSPANLPRRPQKAEDWPT